MSVAPQLAECPYCHKPLPAAKEIFQRKENEEAFFPRPEDLFGDLVPEKCVPFQQPLPSAGEHSSPIDMHRDIATSSPAMLVACQCKAVMPFPLQQQTKTRSHCNQHFAAEVHEFLNNWFNSHSTHPFPTEAEIESMIPRTGLTKKQIRIFFTNKRARSKIPERSLADFVRPQSEK